MNNYNFKDLTGKKFGRWAVISRAPGLKHTRWNCRCECGAERIVLGSNLPNGASQSCGCLRLEVSRAQGKGPASCSWKGGRYLDDNGYVKIMVGSKKRAFEHRLVMERILGRSLYPDETVHHKNGIRDDNRPENLELKASSHGRGQTIPDLIAWAKEILERYSDFKQAA